MTTLQLNLPPDIRARLEARAAESGYATVEQYAQAVLSADASAGLVDEDVEEVLLARHDDAAPGIEVTPAFESGFLEQVRRRRTGGGSSS